MKLNKKRELAARVFDVGKERVVFTRANLEEIKEAITRQDIVDLHKSGAIKIKDKQGRRKIVRRKRQRGKGKVKKKVKNTKQEYVKLTRKLRGVAKHLLSVGRIDNENYKDIRKKIRAKKFKSKRHLNETVQGAK